MAEVDALMSLQRCAVSHLARPYGRDDKVAQGKFFYRGGTGPFIELDDPASDQCIMLEVDAVAFQNKTDSNALLYSSPTCNEPPLRGLSPGESADTMLRSARSVRFEFA
jgi:hypothetical protein